MSTTPAKPPPGEHLTVTAVDRLDRALVPLIGSRSKAADALRAQRVTLDGVVVSLADAPKEVQPGQILALIEPRARNSRRALTAQRILDAHGVGLIAESPSYIAIAKPTGLLSDAATFRQRRDEPNAADLVNAYLQARLGPTAEAFPAHRIDRDTSGVVLFARTRLSEAFFRDRFADRTPTRVYLAAVSGIPETTEGRWEHVMRWDPTTNRQLPARLDDVQAVQASCSWRVLGKVRGPATEEGVRGATSLLEVRLDTGRRNQIRLQAALSGHPLLGERLYHPPRNVPVPPLPSNAPEIGRQALHGLELHIDDPDGGPRLRLTAPPPEDFAKIMRYFGQPS